ncbi:hypothetical protein RI054_45g154730 [Pseudoscourfieldia marina]
MPTPTKPTFTGHPGDFVTYNEQLRTYMEHFNLINEIDQPASAGSSKDNNRATAYRILKESVDVNQSYARHIRLPPIYERQVVQSMVHQAKDPHVAYQQMCDYFHLRGTNTRRQTMTVEFLNNRQRDKPIMEWLVEMQQAAAELIRLGVSGMGGDGLPSHPGTVLSWESDSPDQPDYVLSRLRLEQIRNNGDDK